ncbi:MAG TPA: tetratricopeptide repeat protein [Longimicrobiales bacterium]
MYELRTLGGLDLVRRDCGRAAGVTLPPKTACVLAYLAVERRGRPHRRSVLLELFWPDLDERRARAALSQTLYVLRQALEPGILQSHGREEIVLDASGVWCDVPILEAYLSAGRIGRARELWTGEFLAGVDAAAGRALTRWIEEVRARLLAGFAGADLRAAWRSTSPGMAADPVSDPDPGRGGDRSTLTRDPQVDVLYRRAQSHLVHRGLVNLRKAHSLFGAVLAREPGRAEALAGIAETEILLAMYDPAVAAADTVRSAVRHAVAAVQADPLRPEGHRALGRALQDLGQREAAAQAFDRALELDPLDAEARQWRAGLLLEAGHADRAREEGARAVQLAPHSAGTHTAQAYLAYLMREYPSALSAARRALTFEPEHEGARAIESLALLGTGDPAAAESAARALVEDIPHHVYGRALLAWVRSRTGNAIAPPRAIRRPEPRHDVTGPVVPIVMMRLAERDVAGALEVLATCHWNAVDRTFLAFAAVFDELRPHPRFAALLEQAGLPAAPLL